MPSTLPAALDAPASSDAPAAASRAMIGVLEFGESELRLWDLPFTIGRSSKNTLTIRDPHFSRTHCSIDATPRGYRVQSLSSRNPVRVNGRPIESFLLQDGDRIEISKHAFTFRVVDEDGNPVRPDLDDVPIARPVAAADPSASDALPAVNAEGGAAVEPAIPASAPAASHPLAASPASGVPAAPPAAATAPRRRGFRHMAAHAAQVGQAEVAAFAIGGMLVLVVLGIGAMLLVAQTRAAEDELEAAGALASEIARVRQATATAAIDQRDDARRERAVLDEQRRWLRTRPAPTSAASDGFEYEPDPIASRSVREPSIHQRAEEPPPNAPGSERRAAPPLDPPPARPDPTPPPRVDPPGTPDLPPAVRADPPGPAGNGPITAGPAPRAGQPSLPLLGLRIAGAKVAFVVDSSASQQPILDALRAELTKAVGALGEGQAFTLVAYAGEPRFFSRDLLPATTRFKDLAKRFIDGLLPEGESRPDDALKAMVALERVEALVVVTNGRLTTASTAMIRGAIERAADGGPRVYLVDGAAWARDRTGAAGASDPAHDELMALAARQP